jgi:hypothetical protein
MKTNVTYIDAAKFEQSILALGLKATVQKGFVKVEGPKGRAVYVASTKRVGRVDISGFEMEGPGYVTPHVGPFGNVKQQLDMSLTEEEILANFANLLTHMSSLEPVEKTARTPAAPRTDAPKGWGSIKGGIDVLAANQARKAKIAKKVQAEGHKA